MMASRYAHAKQFKRHHRQLRLLRGRLGRIIRDIRRKITGRPEFEAVFEAPIAHAAQIRSQRQRQRGWKLYSFHAPRSNASSMKGCGSSGCRRAEVRSGQSRRFDCVPPTSALPPSTDIVRSARQVRFVPTTEVAALFDHLLGELLKISWHIDANRPGSFKVDHEIEPLRTL